MIKKGTSGGKAVATGGDYEIRVAAWYCAQVLLGGAVQPLFDLRADDAPVDDVNVKTSDDGNIFVQAKRTVYLSFKDDKYLDRVFEENMVTNFESLFNTWLIDTCVYSKDGTRFLSKLPAEVIAVS